MVLVAWICPRLAFKLFFLVLTVYNIGYSFHSLWPRLVPDSSATNHITTDVNNLSNKTNYDGTDQIFAWDGTGLHIKHIGSSLFHSPLNSKTFVLKQLLHVASITKNLLNVSKFAADNRVYFKFHPNACYVKDLVSNNILMARRVKDGLYAFNSPQLLTWSSSDLPFDIQSRDSSINIVCSLANKISFSSTLLLIKSFSNFQVLLLYGTTDWAVQHHHL